MKKFKKLWISILSIIMTLCLALGAACSCESCNEDEKKGNSSQTPVTFKEYEFQGTHIRTAKDTGKEFIKNGATNYRIVKPARPTKFESIALSEFNKFYGEAVGTTMGSTPDTGLVHSAGQKYLSIGDTELLRSLKDTDKEFDYSYDVIEYEGVRIKTVDDNIYVIGGNDLGTINAVYTLLELLFNYDYFWVDCWEIDKNVKEVNLYDFDVTEVPDFQDRSTYIGVDRKYNSNNITDMDYQYCGFRYRTPDGYWISTVGIPNWSQNADGSWYVNPNSTTGSHNNLDILNPKVYQAEHPAWFSGTDICFSCGAAADPEAEREAMCQELAKRMFQGMLNTKFTDTSRYERFIYAISMEDASSACPCPGCKANTNKYGAYSANFIPVLNRVCELLEQKLAEEKAKCDADQSYQGVQAPNGNYLRYEDYYNEQWKLTFFAYAYGDMPPTYQRADGTYGSDYPEMYFHERVMPWLAKQQVAQYAFYNNDNPRKKDFYDACNGWDALSKNGYMFWGYATNFSDVMVPHNTISGYTPEHYKLLAATNCSQFFLETYWHTNDVHMDTSMFSKIFFYTNSKLTWNVNLDYNELVDKAYDALFQDAADVMREFYDNYNSYYAHLINTTPTGYSTASNTKEHWSLSAVRGWMDYVDVALTKIEGLKETDPELYDRTRKHINAEYISPVYLFLTHYKETVNQEELQAIKTRALSIARENGFNQIVEFVEGLG